MEHRLLKRPTTGRLLIATVLGVFTGLLFGDTARALEPIGNAFVMLLKMTVLPYMVCSLIHGTGSTAPSAAKKMAVAGISVVFTMWIVILSVIEGMALSFPATNPAPAAATAGDAAGIARHFLQMLIPENVFAALANNVVPAIVLFSLLYGAALLRTSKKRILLDFFNGSLEVLTVMTQWIGQLAPFGVFALLAVSTGTWTWEEFCKIELYVLSFVAGCSILVFWTLPRLFDAVSPVPAARFVREIRAPLLLAFTAQSSLICLPYLIDSLKRVMLPQRSSEEDASFETLVPLVYNIPFGNLFVILSVFFFAFFYGVPVGTVDHIKTVLLGVLSVFGSPINSISFLISQLGLPREAANLFIATLPLTGNFLSLLGSFSIAMVSVLILLRAEQRLEVRWTRIFTALGGTVVLVALVVLFLRYSGFIHLENPCG
jgi:proton glutamate symport protein